MPRRLAPDMDPQPEQTDSPTSAIRLDGDPTARFLARVPADNRGRLLRLEQEDHYLRAHTDRGQPLIHCRMRDAERELADADGLRVHRSHWVARAAVVGTFRRHNRLYLRLRDGSDIPIGKTYRPALKAKGWL
jgi:DNA-binding LytR/AlgR family response regulator